MTTAKRRDYVNDLGDPRDLVAVTDNVNQEPRLSHETYTRHVSATHTSPESGQTLKHRPSGPTMDRQGRCTHRTPDYAAMFVRSGRSRPWTQTWRRLPR